MAKLRKAVVKVKEVLSANEEFAISVEGILPDVDFRCPMSRSLLDDIAAKAGLTARIVKPIESVLVQSGLALSDVDVVEIIGGGVRMQRVQTVLREYLNGGKAPAASTDGVDIGRLGQHLNGDDAPALGAAFFAANRSVSFRVRKVGMVDGLAQGIGARLTHLNASGALEVAPATGASDSESGGAGKAWSKRSSLFKAYDHIDSVKRISFPADRDLRAVLFYEVPTSASPPLPEGAGRNVAAFNITGLTALLADEKTASLGVPKVHLSFELDINGLVRVLRAEATHEVTEQELVTPTPSPSLAPNATKSNATAAANETDPSASPSPSPSASKSAGDGDASADGAASPAPSTAAAAADAASDPAEPVYRTVKRTLRYPLTVVDDTASVVQVPTLSSADKAAAAGMLRRLAKADEERRTRESAKNALEAYIYAARDRRDVLQSVEDAAASWDAFTSEEERTAVSDGLMSAEEWLYGDGSSAEAAEYKK